jgi:hypothetical protein
MKKLLFILSCFLALNGFAQTSEPILQEKSSAWIKIAEDPIIVKKPETITRRPVSVRKKVTSPKRQTAPKQDAQEEFEKTNSQVNRFKKKG